MRVVAVWGNIGAGKSSVLRGLDQMAPFLGWEVVCEPVHIWHDFLPLVYSDPKRWLFLFQIKVLEHYLDLTMKLLRNPEKYQGKVVIVERSPFEVLDVFLRANQSQFIEPSQFEAARVTAQALCDMPIWRDARHIMIQTDLETCQRRVALRNRPGEDKMSEGYLAQLHECYESARLSRSIPLIRNNVDREDLAPVAIRLLAFCAEDGS